MMTPITVIVLSVMKTAIIFRSENFMMMWKPFTQNIYIPPMTWRPHISIRTSLVYFARWCDNEERFCKNFLNRKPSQHSCERKAEKISAQNFDFFIKLVPYICTPYNLLLSIYIIIRTRSVLWFCSLIFNLIA